MDEYPDAFIAYRNVVDREIACDILKEMHIWSERLSECLTDYHTFLHEREGDGEDLLKRIIYCKNRLAIMWAVPFPVDFDRYELVGSSPASTLS